jgi:hypothetical protein
MGTKSDLVAFLSDNPPAETFKPYCYTSKEADTLTTYFSDAADYSKRLNDHVTLYLSLTTGDVVGCRIKGISGIIQDLPNYIEINHDRIQLSLIFFAFRGCAEEEGLRTINQLATEASKYNLVV